MGVLGGYFYWKVVLKFWFGHQKYHFWYPQNTQIRSFSIHQKPLKKHWDIWFWKLLQFSTLPTPDGANNCYTSNMNINMKQGCKKAAVVAVRQLRVRLQSAWAKTKLGLSTSKRFRSCFTNTPPKGSISSLARMLDNSSIVRMNIKISWEGWAWHNLSNSVICWGA